MQLQLRDVNMNMNMFIIVPKKEKSIDDWDANDAPSNETREYSGKSKAQDGCKHSCVSEFHTLTSTLANTYSRITVCC